MRKHAFLISVAVTIVWCALFMSLTNLNGMNHLDFILNSMGLIIVPTIFYIFFVSEDAVCGGEGGETIALVLCIAFAAALYNLMECAGIIHWLNS